MLAVENWDDDFLFNPGSPNNSPSARAVPRGSVSSSRSDWDAEPEVDVHLDARFDVDAAPEVPSTPARSKWTEKTPTKSRRVINGGGGGVVSKHAENEDENWDDDFEDDDPEPNSHPPPLPSHKSPALQPCLLSSDSDSDADDFGMGSPSRRERDDAEDRTVTARSRPQAARNAQSHAQGQGQKRRASPSRRGLDYVESPPPPVPALPASLHTSQSTTSLANEPFPAQPVFTPPVPAQNNRVRAESQRAKEVLPPSPPVPKERERRRLRKKSRPSDASVPSSRRNSVADERDGRDGRPPPSPRLAHARPQPRTPPTLSPERETTSPTSPRLLARIGSVKKWGVRRKRGSTEPSSLARPDSAASDFSNFSVAPSTLTHNISEAQQARSGWFFRSGSGGTNSGSVRTAG